MRYEKGSFITVPNRDSLFGLEPYVQSVYFWICNFADKDGSCFPSRTTLAKCGGCSLSSVDRALEQLVVNGLLTKITRRNGEKNLTNLYQIMIVDTDLEGGGVSEKLPSVSEKLGVASEGRTELNTILTKPTEEGALEDELRVVKVYESEDGAPSRKKTKYPNARIAFSWLPNRQASWDSNTTQLTCGELLFKRGEEAVKSFVRYVKAREDDDGFDWIFVQPSDYERKWETIKAYAKRNG